MNDLATNRRYYLLPGTIPVNTLVNEAKSNTYSSSLSFPLPFTQSSVIVLVTISFTAVLGAGEAVTFHIYKNAGTSPVLSLTLSNGEGQFKSLTTSSVSFAGGDILRTTLETTGDPSTNGAFCGIIGYY